MAGRVEQHGVGAGAGGKPSDVVAAQCARAARRRGPTASSGVMPISRTASAMQNGMLVV